MDNVRAAFFAIGVLGAAALTYIAVSTWLAPDPHPFACHPGDVATTNGRELCPPHGGFRQ